MLSKRALLIVTTLGFTLLVAMILHFIPREAIPASSPLPIENVAAQSNQKEIDVGLAIRLKIPVIGVDSTIIPIGLTSDGAMDVPKDPDEVAWYNLGPRPGESGSAVIAGHYDWENNKPAVFNNLDKLSNGDKISVENENGVVTTFVVSKIRTYDKDEDASDVFTSDDGKAHLNLITCTGVWDKISKSYSKRLVIFTDKE